MKTERVAASSWKKERHYWWEMGDCSCSSRRGSQPAEDPAPEHEASSFNHPCFRLLLLRRSHPYLQPSVLSAQILKLKVHRAVTELLVISILPLDYWLKVLREGVELVLALHAQGLSLCISCNSHFCPFHQLCPCYPVPESQRFQESQFFPFAEILSCDGSRQGINFNYSNQR
jgi:hypothetical protein